LAAAPTPGDREARTRWIAQWVFSAHRAFDLKEERAWAAWWPRREDYANPGFMVAEATPEFRMAYAAWCVAVDNWKAIALQRKWARNRQFAILRNTIRKRDRLAAEGRRKKGYGR